MKLNIVFFIFAIQTAVQASWASSDIITGPLGCGLRFRIKKYRGRTIAIPLDPECQVLPGTNLGLQRTQSRYGPTYRRFVKNWSRFPEFPNRQYNRK